MNRFALWRRRLVWTVVSAALLLVLAFVSIDFLAAMALRSVGSSALGVSVDASNVHVGLTNGPCTIANLAIQNPAGCTEANFLLVRTISVDASAKAFLEPVVMIPSVSITGITLDLERLSEGGTNAQVLLNHMAKVKGTQRQDPTASSQGTRVIIAELVLSDITLHAGARVSIVPLGATLHKDRIVLKNVDSAASDLGVGHQLISLLTETVVAAIIDSFGDQLSSAVKSAIQGAASVLDEVGGKQLQDLGNSIGKILGGLPKGDS